MSCGWLEIVRGAETSPGRARHRDRARPAARQGAGRWSASATASSATACSRRCSVEAERLLLEGALPQEVDAALTEFGLPMGPFAMGDMAGLDVGWRIRKSGTASANDRRYRTGSRCARPGRYGQKTGQGLLPLRSRAAHAAPRSGGRDDDPRRRRRGSASTRRPIADEEIVERMISPMINEGATHPRGGHRAARPATST